MTTEEGPRSLLPAATIEALGRGDLDAVEALREAVRKRLQERGGHVEWGRLCEAAGEFGLALTEYQLALRDDPNDAAALARLNTLYEERGELDRAVECAERWVRAARGEADAVRALVDLLVAAEQFERAREVLAGDEGAALPSEEREAAMARVRAAARAIGEADDEELLPELPTDADVVRFHHLFSGRENVYARQWAGERGEGGYSPVREPLTVQVVRNHLLGNVTVGVYLVRLDNTVTFFAFDIDIRKHALARARGSLAEARRLRDVVAREGRRFQSGLEALGIPALLEDSGYKGRHLWVFLDAPEDAGVLRQFGALFLQSFPLDTPDLQAEFFPKQATVAGGVGNLIKLPLGIHRRTGRRSRLLEPDGSPCADPHGMLRRHPRLSREVLYAAIGTLKAGPQGSPRGPGAGATAEQPVESSESTELTVAGVAFPAPRPAWTEADFDTHPEISHILRHCPVLDALKRKVEQHRRLSHDEQVVLTHAMGHSGAGVLAVNYLLEACVDVPPSARLQSPLAGNPVSCPKIRKRIPHITGSVPCNCRFEFAADHYPTPRLHLLNRSPEAAPPPSQSLPAWDAVDRARALRVLRLRHRKLEEEIDQIEAELVAHMESSGISEIDAGEVLLRLRCEEGAPAALVWEVAQREPDPAAAGGRPAEGP